MAEAIVLATKGDRPAALQQLERAIDVGGPSWEMRRDAEMLRQQWTSER